MIVDIFKIGVWKCDGNHHLHNARTWFQNSELNFVKNFEEDKNFLTTLNGYGSIQSRVFPTGDGVESFEEFILDNSYYFLASIGEKVESLNLEVKRIWLNEMTSKSHHSIHSHYGNIISGCFYVDLPEGSSSISFESPMVRFDSAPLECDTYTNYNSSMWSLSPNEGDVYMWNSCLRHFVPEQIFDGTRRTIAFDVSWA